MAAEPDNVNVAGTMTDSIEIPGINLASSKEVYPRQRPTTGNVNVAVLAAILPFPVVIKSLSKSPIGTFSSCSLWSLSKIPFSYRQNVCDTFGHISISVWMDIFHFRLEVGVKSLGDTVIDSFGFAVGKHISVF